MARPFLKTVGFGYIVNFDFWELESLVFGEWFLNARYMNQLSIWRVIMSHHFIPISSQKGGTF